MLSLSPCVPMLAVLSILPHSLAPPPCQRLPSAAFTLLHESPPWLLGDAAPQPRGRARPCQGCLFQPPLSPPQTARTIRRRHCYPPTWKRWAFYLCPGALIAAAAVLLYAFVETEENYFYIHSIWHLLIAGSVGFLLPPRAKPSRRLGPLPRRKGCGYQLCVNEQEELGLVDPAVASINSICTS